MTAARRVAAVIRKHGEPFDLTLEGDAEDSPRAQATVGVKAKRIDASGKNTAGDMQQRTIVVKMSNDELASHSPPLRAPRRLDTLAAEDGALYVIQDVDTRKDGRVVVMHIITATGDA